MALSPTVSLRRDIPDLSYKRGLRRNLLNRSLTFLAGIFSAIAVLPLIAVLAYVLIKGGGVLNLTLFTAASTGLEGGGIGNAVIGTIIVTFLSALIAIPVGVGGGISLLSIQEGGALQSLFASGPM